MLIHKPANSVSNDERQFPGFDPFRRQLQSNRDFRPEPQAVAEVGKT